MTLIQKFFVPAEELADVGLSEINMSRLGRFVALAGKNGAGKSRILNKLETYVGARLNGLSVVTQRQQSVVGLEKTIRSNPGHPSQPQWQQLLESERTQLSITLERVIAAPEATAFKAVRFVPKQLALQDPQQYANRELISRYAQAKSPGVNGYEANCLFYVQQLQARWWNADHQRFSGSKAEKELALSDYESFLNIVQRLLGVPLDRNLDGAPTLFGKPIADAGLSDGQKVILQLCVALHAQKSELENSIFLLDEPENHLHPSAAIDLLKMLYEVTGTSQIWIATHSIPLLAYVASEEPMSLWYVNDGTVSSAGRHPEVVLDSLLGSEDRVGQLNAFTSLPAQLAVVNYAMESLFPPRVLGAGTDDPQVNQIQRLVTELRRNAPLPVLDYGAGKGRLLEGIEAGLAAMGQSLPETLDYFAFDEFASDKDVCERVIRENFVSDSRRYFNTRDEFFSHKEESSIAVVVMCNVLHEISPRDWIELFSAESLIRRALRDDGYLLLVEDQRIPVGEKAHEYGFMVMDTSHLRTLFSVTDDDVTAGRFSCDDGRNDGRLKAHLIGKALLSRITSQTRSAAIKQLKETAKDNIRQLRTKTPTYANGQFHGFWTQQFANASLYLGDD